MHSTNPIVAVHEQKYNTDSLAFNTINYPQTSSYPPNPNNHKHNPHPNNNKFPASSRKVYIVIHSTANILATGLWDQNVARIKGVYLNERDADDKVLLLYEEAMAGKAREIKLWDKGDGSQCFRWQTTKQTIDGCHVRVHVEKWDVTVESDDLEKALSLFAI